MADYFFPFKLDDAPHRRRQPLTRSRQPAARRESAPRAAAGGLRRRTGGTPSRGRRKAACRKRRGGRRSGLGFGRTRRSERLGAFPTPQWANLYAETGAESPSAAAIRP